MTTQAAAAQPGSSIDSRLGCSTISFRAWTFSGALAEICGQGFAGYRGHYSLELETHDIEHADRPQEAGRAGRYITSLLQGLSPAAFDADSRT
jgi:hypothetical protein